MKHSLTRIAMIISLFLMVIGSSMAQSTTASGTVTASYLNVRSTPAITANRITTLTSGYTAGIIGKNSDSTWYQILIPGGSGWVYGTYLTITNANTIPITYNSSSVPTPVATSGYVNTGALNIRPIPSPTNNIPITYVLRNTSLTVIARNTDNSWYKVLTNNNIQGWVRSKYLTITTGNINTLPIITENNPQPTPMPANYAQGYVNTGALNIRTTPSPFNNTPIKYILRNTNVSVIGRTADSQWYQVTVSGVYGWVRGKYITITSGNQANAPVTG